MAEWKDVELKDGARTTAGRMMAMITGGVEECLLEIAHVSALDDAAMF